MTAGGIGHRRRLGRQLYRGARRSDAGWTGRRRRRRARREREHSARPHRGPDGAARHVVVAALGTAGRANHAHQIVFFASRKPSADRAASGHLRSAPPPEDHSNGSASPLRQHRRNRLRSASFEAAARAWNLRRSPSFLRSPTPAGHPGVPACVPIAPAAPRSIARSCAAPEFDPSAPAPDCAAWFRAPDKSICRAAARETSDCAAAARLAPASPARMPACGPPSSLSPLNDTRFTPARMLSATSGSSTPNARKSATQPLPRSSYKGTPRSFAKRRQLAQLRARP